MVNITEKLSKELKEKHIKIKIPKWSEVNEKVDKKIELNPLEEFIYKNEIAGTKKIVDVYRYLLIEMLEHVKYNT